jgi:hypothetical protein
MPTPTAYTYSIATNFPNHLVASDRLTMEIGQSSIVTALDHIDTSGDAVNIWFKDVLSGGDQTTLNGVVAAHSGVPLSVTASATGSITGSGQSVSLVLSGSATLGLQITGTWVATLVPEATIDGSNWFSIEAFSVGDVASITSISANGQWRIAAGGVVQVRIRCSAYTSGSATITLQATGSAAIVRTVSGAASLISGYSSTSSNARVIIAATTYTEQLTNAQRSVSSSSASDTSAGTGARTIRITYYDQTMAGPFTEDITLNGTSTVNTVGTNICFIESLRVLTAGSGGNNAGTITLFISTAGAGGTIGTIATNDNQTNWCHHYIAKDKTMFLTQVLCGNQGCCNGSLSVLRNTPTIADSTDLVVVPQVRVQSGTTESVVFSSPVRVSGPARVQLQIKQDSVSASNNWFAGFAYQEV